MISIHTNAVSLASQRALSQSQHQAAVSMQRLSTGLRINSAMDDAAGLQIATRLDAQVNGMNIAMRNTQNAVSMLQTSEGALGEVTNILNRMKDLATQSADASSSNTDRTAMQSEYDNLGEELNNIMKNTSFGGQKLLMGTGVGTGTAAGSTFAASVNFQIGASSGEKMSLDLTTNLNGSDTALQAISAHYTTTGGAAGTEISSAASSNTMIDTLSTALDSIGSLRSQMGAAANRLDHVHNNLGNMVNYASQAKGRITDTDYATETAALTTHQMLSQTSATMLKQSGSLTSLAMSLLG